MNLAGKQTDSARTKLQRIIAVGIYAVLLTLVSSHTYFHPLYDVDMMGYVGNAVAISGTNIAEIHDAAYRALAAEAPDLVKDHLLG